LKIKFNRKSKNPSAQETKRVKAKGQTRKKIKSIAGAPKRLAKMLSRTAHYLHLIKKNTGRDGHVPRPVMRDIIHDWANEILDLSKVTRIVKGEAVNLKDTVLFVGTHISYLDIPLLMASVPVVFVSKEEISKWFVIGPASKHAGTVFVKRESASSRAKTAQAIADCLVERQQSLAIFPAGTTYIDRELPWRPGAFKVAHRHKLKVQPFRLIYEPLRTAAFIEKDILAPHMLNLLSHPDGVAATIEFGPVTTIQDPVADMEKIRQWCNGLLPLDANIFLASEKIKKSKIKKIRAIVKLPKMKRVIKRQKRLSSADKI
jgi:1-acyl-sn-glycerol-3-phosphate acyltransferase